MSFRRTNPHLVISRMYTDALRLRDWAKHHGTPKQQELADFFVKSLLRASQEGNFPLNSEMDHEYAQRKLS